MQRLLTNIAIFFLAIAGITGVAHAQDQGQQQDQSQPGVARISRIEGNVSVLRSDSGDWVTATLNTPLMNGDTISTGPDSRAEVQLDYADVIRLDSNSTAKIANLTGNNIQVQVAQGRVSYDVLGQSSAQVEIRGNAEHGGDSLLPGVDLKFSCFEALSAMRNQRPSGEHGGDGGFATAEAAGVAYAQHSGPYRAWRRISLRMRKRGRR